MAFICNKPTNSCPNCEHYRYDDDYAAMSCFAEWDRKRNEIIGNKIKEANEAMANTKTNKNIKEETIMHTAKYSKTGNIKVGHMWVFNKLAGSGEIAGVKGSCSKYCNGACYNVENPKKSSCYVFKSYVQYGWDNGSVVKSHINNTLAMRESIDGTFESLDKMLKRARKKPDAIRIHASGELESAEELKGHIKLARKYPKIPMYIYTKAVDIVEEVFEEDPSLPDNFFLNVSIWHEFGWEFYNKWKHIPNVKAFVYDDDYDYKQDEQKTKIYCPAYRPIQITKKNGETVTKVKLFHDVTCDECKLCLSNKVKITYCHSH